jgi:hypothetical protein
MPISSGQIVDFPEGRTNEWLVHGLFIIGFSIFFSATVYGGFLLFAIPGFILPFAKAGTEINKQKWQIRRYKKLLGFKMGAWESFQNLQKLEIQLLRISTVHQHRTYIKNSLYTAFELVFTYEGPPPFIYNDYLDYSTVCAVADLLLEICPDAEIQNHIEEKINNPHRRR